MSFFDQFKEIDFQKTLNFIEGVSAGEVEQVLQKETIDYDDFLKLLSSAAISFLPEMAKKSIWLTKKHFGNTMGLYVPLYLSNECSNGCSYCGFNKNADVTRSTLSLEEAEKEIKYLRDLGFRNILLLTGEDYRKISPQYVADAIKIARKYFDYVSLEVFPASEEVYKLWTDSGVSGLTIYQETYDVDTYDKVHLFGKKKDFRHRLETPERALAAGMRKVGVGALLGLSNYKIEAAALAKHADYLHKKYWRAELSISFPRIRNMGIDFVPENNVSDKVLLQLILALRIFMPWVGLVLSTREEAEFRDNLMDIGITQMSAESKTNPGGYSGCSAGDEQFSVADKRTLAELMEVLDKKGYDPVLKDWSYDFKGVSYADNSKR